MEQKSISKAVIQRLPRYYRYLGEIKAMGMERISSNELSERMNVTASQIRQDLNNFGGFGQQGYGYNVQYLYAEIGKILGLNEQHNMIVVGAGHLGQAIANYTNFERRGFSIKAMFDISPEKIGTNVRGIPVYDTSDLVSYLHTHDTHMAALTIPSLQAEQMAQVLIDNGIKAIWNFAHTDLKVPKGVVVENVHLSESLMRLSYRYQNQNKEKEKE